MAQSNFRAISLIEKRVSTHFHVFDDQCLYNCYSKRGATLYLKCIDEDCQCNGKIVNNIFTRTNNALHNHDYDHETVANYEDAYAKLRQAIKIDRRPIRVLHNEALRGLSLEASGMLSWNHCRRTLERVRHDMMPPCRSMVDLEKILEDDNTIGYSMYGRIRQSRFYQGSVDGQLVFANLELLGELPANFDIYIDATFGVTPFHARQLLVILCDLRGRPRPIIYAIMNGQATENYSVIFEFIRDGIISFDGLLRTPNCATTDFEQAIRLALDKVWPNIRKVGCYFHFAQAIRRNARSIKSLSASLIGDTIQHKVLIMFIRLGLLPLERVDAGFNAVLHFISSNKLEDDFQDFADYFRRTWFGRYPKEDWCVSDREKRTNNHLEGYNHRIKQTIPSNPSAWKFLDSLIDLGYDASSNYSADVLNNATPPVDRSLLSLPLGVALKELQDGTIDEIRFLEKLSTPR